MSNATKYQIYKISNTTETVTCDTSHVTLSPCNIYMYISVWIYIYLHMDVYIDIYIDFFLVFTWSHIKCKQHRASHNIIIAGPGPMRPRGPYKAQQCKSYTKQSKASQSNATQCHTTSFPLPVPPETVTGDTVSLSSVAEPAFWWRCCETRLWCMI